MPLKLNDDELDIVMAACRPIEPYRRDAFMSEVANVLGGYQELGVGLVARVCRDVQRRHFDPPDLGGGGVQSKYR